MTYLSSSPTGEQFDIRKHLELPKPQSRNGWVNVPCPSCQSDHKPKRPSLRVETSTGAYKCFKGCATEHIRESLGSPKDRAIPTALTHHITASAPAKRVTIAPQQVKEAQQRLLGQGLVAEAARTWLERRGITVEMIKAYRLGLVRKRCGRDGPMLWAIALHIPADRDGTAYYQKSRLAPWLPESEQPPEYMPWSQYGVPPVVYFTWKPTAATVTWLCEGEWDAYLLGWAVREHIAGESVAVATFTSGCGTVPPTEELERLPGRVVTFYDRNDAPHPKTGLQPGEEGAKKVALALGERGWIAQVPWREKFSHVQGWDVSNALNAGFGVGEFQEAAEQCVQPEPKATSASASPTPVQNPLRAWLVTNDQLLARAANYVDWLVPDLLPSNELFLLATAPRGGKSLMGMTLAHAVGTGQKFLDRPTTQGPVLYVNLEDSEIKIKERELAQGWGAGLPIYWLNKFKLSQLPYLIELAEEIQPRLIVLDTLSRVRDDSISESSAEMSRALEPLQELASYLPATILLIHHTAKVNVSNASELDVFETIRGSSAIRATCRGTWILGTEGDTHRLFVEHGYGKLDLQIRLNPDTLTWRLLGQWKPAVNRDQRERVLDYLNEFGSGTVEQIAIACQLPIKSAATVLGRLQADDLISKQGGRRGTPATYHRSRLVGESLEKEGPQTRTATRPVGEIGELLEKAKTDTASDSGVAPTKNNIFSSSDPQISDQPNANCHISTPVFTDLRTADLTHPPQKAQPVGETAETQTGQGEVSPTVSPTFSNCSNKTPKNELSEQLNDQQLSQEAADLTFANSDQRDQPPLPMTKRRRAVALRKGDVCRYKRNAPAGAIAVTCRGKDLTVLDTRRNEQGEYEALVRAESWGLGVEYWISCGYLERQAQKNLKVSN
ncbi:AAA family ATPase [Leptolyngbya sp. FACHB-261]|uniref:AAA family ATPase n=1 Tax=Leptolyngbya sp. FACHB-261 TaxID=2692806 RepID=UPI0016833AD8|nr:AAA family ATPase [Leptolyngbya sp. FACHB-261]MBD2100280.1 AAA family ATPase [Leptolyngbya sp. FACHB-261]